jgi:hypothetical protein
MACLGITGAMRTAPTAAMDASVVSPPLHLKVEAEARVGNFRPRCNDQWKPSFSLGQYPTVFQAEVYAIKACAVENLDRKYKTRNIYILSESQSTIKALGTQDHLKIGLGLPPIPHTTSGQT